MATPISERAQLAELALTTALEHRDVLEGVGGPGGMTVTIVGEERLRGVSVHAAPGGGYAVILRVVTAIVPLRTLAEDLRRRVRAGAAESPQVGEPTSISIQIAGVRSAT